MYTKVQLKNINEIKELINDYVELSNSEILNTEKLNFVKILKKLKQQREYLDREYAKLYVELPKEWQVLPRQLRLAMITMNVYVYDLWETSTNDNDMSEKDHLDNFEHFNESLQKLTDNYKEIVKNYPH